jgi:hypothetical protein
VNVGKVGGQQDAADLDADDVVKRIAAECTFVDERGAVGMRGSLLPVERVCGLWRECGEALCDAVELGG